MVRGGRGGHPGREAADDLAALGLRLDEDVEDDDGADDFEVWPENWDAVQVFAAMAGHWRRDPLSGGYVGLDYPAVESVMRMLKVADTASTFRDLQTMERVALPVLRQLNG